MVEELNPKPQTCLTCRWWTGENDHDQGLCHAMPPQIRQDLKTGFPWTNAGTWCGQWQSKSDGVTYLSEV